MKKLIYLFLLILLHSCIQDDVSFRDAENNINIFLVDENQQIDPVNEQKLNSLDLVDKPWIMNSEIEFYDWSAHMFYLNVEKERGKYAGRYFLVKDKDEPLFLGCFFPPWASSIPYYPSVIAWDNVFSANDVVEIGGFGGMQRETMDSKINFKTALQDAGLFREGIKVEILSVQKISTGSLKYTFKVTNLEDENIYVLDPDKMGVSRFNYFTNGVYLKRNNNYYSSENIDYTPAENIDTRWYYRLLPGASFSRTVVQSGFQSIPTGQVTVSFSFPGSRVSKGDWRKSDGRIWLGSLRTEKDLEIK